MNLKKKQQQKNSTITEQHNAKRKRKKHCLSHIIHARCSRRDIMCNQLKRKIID